GAQQLAATAGLFGYDDTAGTLIAFRGWALHDLKSQAQGRFELPPLSPIARLFQDTETYSTLEIDHRLGWYAKLEWRPDAPVTVEALYFGKRTFGLTDVAFQAADAELAQDVGKATLSGRLDAFATQDRAPLPPVGPGEHGWALTGAVRYPLNDYLDLRLEALRIESTRPSRALVGEPPRQGQTVLQSSLRLTF